MANKKIIKNKTDIPHNSEYKCKYTKKENVHSQ